MFSFFFKALSVNPFLTAVAILPAVFLMVKIYRSDPLGQQPKSFLLLLIWMGVISTALAVVLELIGARLVTTVATSQLMYNILYYFLVVALAEEGSKYLMLRRISWNSPNFRCRFDGVVYAAFVSLGFALTENVAYVLLYGMGTAMLRAVTAIPAHASCGIFMGALYGTAKQYERYNQRKSRWHRFLSLVIPAFFHGAYDFIVAQKRGLSLLFFVFSAVLFFAAYKLIKDLSWQGGDFYSEWGEPGEKIDGGRFYIALGAAVTLVSLFLLFYPERQALSPASPSSPATAGQTQPSSEKRTEAPTSVVSAESAEASSAESAAPSEYQLPASVVEKRSLAQTAFDLMNMARRAQGLAALVWDEGLYQCALVRAEEITRQFEITRPDGRDSFSVLQDYPCPAVSQLLGENIASGYRNASAVHDAFMGSPGHRDNIMNSQAGFAAVACVLKNGILYWVQLIAQ